MCVSTSTHKYMLSGNNIPLKTTESLEAPFYTGNKYPNGVNHYSVDIKRMVQHLHTLLLCV